MFRPSRELDQPNPAIPCRRRLIWGLRRQDREINRHAREFRQPLQHSRGLFESCSRGLSPHPSPSALSSTQRPRPSTTTIRQVTDVVDSVIVDVVLRGPGRAGIWLALPS